MRTMKKVLAAGLTAVMAMSLMGGCGSKKDDSSSKTYNLGIIQFAEHGSLDNCRKGFLKGLESEGIKEGENLKITYKNSQADTATDNQIASNFASKKLDMICAIATPSAQSAYNATKDSDIPVVYTAVTSPKAAGFVDKEGKNVGNITGTSDLVLADKQLKLIRQMMPKAKNVGIFYTGNHSFRRYANGSRQFTEESRLHHKLNRQFSSQQHADIPSESKQIKYPSFRI